MWNDCYRREAREGRTLCFCGCKISGLAAWTSEMIPIFKSLLRAGGDVFLSSYFDMKLYQSHRC